MVYYLTIGRIHLCNITAYIYIRGGVVWGMAEGERNNIIRNIERGRNGRPCVASPVHRQPFADGVQIDVGTVGEMAVITATLGKGQEQPISFVPIHDCPCLGLDGYIV